MNSYEGEKANYYLTRANTLTATGVSFVIGHFMEAKPYMPGGDDGIEGPGYFWIMRQEGSYSHLRVKRIVRLDFDPYSRADFPTVVPVTDSSELTTEVVQRSFEDMIDEHFAAKKEEFNNSPTVGEYDMVRIASLLTTSTHDPEAWKK